MHVRVTTLQLQPGQIDDAAAGLEQNDLPMIRGLDGFKGFTLFADRSSGKTIANSYWESEEALAASEEAVKEARANAASAGGASAEPQVERFEVVLDTMA